MFTSFIKSFLSNLEWCIDLKGLGFIGLFTVANIADSGIENSGNILINVAMTLGGFMIDLAIALFVIGVISAIAEVKYMKQRKTNP